MRDSVALLTLVLLALVSPLCLCTGKTHQIHHYEPDLNSNHKVLFVKWSEIDDSTFLLAIGSPETSSASSSHTQLFRSSKATDEKFVEIPMDYPDGLTSYADQIYLNGSQLLITDSENKVVCSTKDYNTLSTASALACSQVAFDPTNVIFHKDLTQDILALDRSTNELYHSDNYGGTWDLIAEKILSVDWESWSGKNAIYVTRFEADDDSTINQFNVIKSTDFFKESNVMTLSKVERFEVHDDLMFAVSRVVVPDYSSDGKKVHVNLHVSHRDSNFQMCSFHGDKEMNDKSIIEFKVIDVYDGQAFLVVGYYLTHSGNHETGPVFYDLYISDVYGARFQLSLPNIGFISSTFDTEQLREETETFEDVADFYSVLGLEGVFMASVLVNPGSAVKGSPEKRLFQTVITYNKGVSWEPVVVPAEQSTGPMCDADKDENCRIQIAQSPIFKANMGSLQPVYSSASAPGMVVATGFVGNSLTLENFTETNGDKVKMHNQASYMFLSVNGGVSFSVGLRGLWIYNFLDSGGFLVCVEPYSSTQILWFTYNQGSSWHAYEFSDKPMRVFDAKTKPGEKTTILTLFASFVDDGTNEPDGNWRIVNVDFTDYFSRSCSPGNEVDYDMEWKVNAEGRTDLCILGKRQTFVRRYPTVECLNGPDFESKAEEISCTCSRADYTCDFDAFYNDVTKECDLDGQSQSVQEQCADASGSKAFFSSKGYQRILGDKCEPDEEAYTKWEPLHRACPSQPPTQFLMVLDRHNVHRLTITDNAVDNIDKVVDVGPHNEILSIGFSYSKNILFYAEKCSHDSRNSMVKKLDFSTFDPPIIIHESEADQVVDIAVDFVNDHLYWTVTERASNDYSIVMSDFNGGKKRTIISRGDGINSIKVLAIDPFKGYMFWVDWGQPPFIKRATIDGRDIQPIVTDKLFWSESLSVDLFTSEPKGWVYWVESFYGRVERVHYDGSNRKIVLALTPDNILSSSAVFKNWIYVGLEGEMRLAKTDKEHSENEIEYTGPFMSEVTDSDYPKKILALSQAVHDNEATRKNYRCAKDNGGCSHICVQINANTHVCLCPDGMVADKAEGSLNETCSCPAGETLNGKLCQAEHCGDDMFTCDNSRCIPKRWRCDFTEDCKDKSDERDCDYERCQSYEFTCEKTHKCIPKIWQCDFDYDCGEVNGQIDRSDEETCDYPECKPSEFQCNNKKCISMDWTCDHDKDCLDHSDEDNCTIVIDSDADMTTCDVGGFACSDGKLCIPKQWQCDGFKDCADNSDENDCITPICNSRFQFRCANPKLDGKIQCIYSIHVCDGEKDCADGSDEDEAYCGQASVSPPPKPATPGPDVAFANGTCPGDDIPCPSASYDSNGKPIDGEQRKCIPANWFCDHVQDCADGTDELNCQNSDTNPGCTDNYFACTTGPCIPKDWRCDRTIDCGDGSDEKDCGSHGGHTEQCSGVNEFSCLANGRLFCFSKSVICDGYTDCPDGSDEKNCDLPDGGDTPSGGSDREVCGARSATDCESHSKCALCGDKTQCIAKSSKCNQAFDCVDGSDETNCKADPTVCNDESFKCVANDDCYPARYVCDGAWQCIDKSDEDDKLCAGVKTGQVVEIYATEAVVTWGIPKNTAGMKQFHVQWKAQSSSETAKGNDVTKAMDQSDYGITGLEPFKSYKVLVFVEYDDGSTTEKAAWTTIFTTKEALSSPPTKFAVNTQPGIPGTVYASWVKPMQPNGEITMYHVFYKSVSDNRHGKQSFTADPSKETISAQVDGLEGFSEAEFWVAAENLAGIGNASLVKTVNFQSDLDYNDFPKNVHVSEKSQTPIKDTVIIVWDPVTIQSSNSRQSVKYRVTWKMMGDDTINGIRNQTVSETEVTLGNLSPGETYSVEVSTLFGKEESPFSDPLTVVTSGSKLPTPINLECSFANQKRFESLKLSWSLPESLKKDDVKNYAVYYATNPQKLHSVAPLKVASSGLKDRKSSTIVSDLLSGTSYFMAVRIMELNNGVKKWGAVSKTIRCSTEDNPMTPPRDLQCLPADTSTNISLSWKAPRESMLKSYTYRIMWKYTQDKDYSLFEEQVGKKEVELHSVFDLKNPGLDFEFKIEATNASGHMINPSEIVKCSSANRNPPIVNLAYWNFISWTAPDTMNRPNEGYVVYGIEKLEDFENRAVEKWMTLGETKPNITYWKDFEIPSRIHYVTVALKPYKEQDTQYLSAMGQPASVKEIIFNKPSSHITVDDLVHDRIMVKIMVPVALVVLGLLVTVGMLYHKNRVLQQNIHTAAMYNKENGITFGVNDPDEGDSAIPYGRLQAGGDDYNDDVMMVNT